jgi:hypothetical protein
MPNDPQVRVAARRGALILAALLILAGLGGAVAYGTSYGTLAWWSDPAKITWCGRVYLPSTGPTVSRATVEQQRASLPGDQPYPVTEVTRVPPLIGRAVLASVTPPATRERLGIPCAMVVYLDEGADSYRPYVLSGGP